MMYLLSEYSSSFKIFRDAALNSKDSGDSGGKALYDRMVEKGKNKKLAIIAVCNKLLKQVFGVIKSGILYQDDYYKNIA